MVDWREPGPLGAAWRRRAGYVDSYRPLRPDRDEAGARNSGEDADAFDDLWNRVRADLSPVGPIEELLVDRIVNAMSTLQLFARAETALYRWRVNELRVDWLTRQCQRRLNSDPVCCFSRLNPHPPHCPKVRGGTAYPGSA